MINKPRLEAVKEVLRYVILFVVSWIITETLKQISLVPTLYEVRFWVFVYAIPVQALLTFLLVLVGRYIDKYKFTKSKQELEDLPKHLLEQEGEPKGILPF